MPSVAKKKDAYAKINNSCLVLLASVAFTGVLIYTRSILVPFVFAIFGYAVVTPILSWFRDQLKAPQWLSIVMTLCLFLGGLSILVFFFASSIGGFIESADQYRDRVAQFVQGAAQLAARFNINIDSEAIRSEIHNLPVFSFAKSLTGGVVALFANLFLVFIFLSFLVLGEGRTPPSSPLVMEIRGKVSRYVATKFLTSGSTGSLTALVLWAHHIEMAGMFGILATLLNFIPNFGSIIAVAIPVPVVLLQYGLGWQFYAVLGVTGGIQFIIGNVIEPKVMGESLDLHPVTVLIFLMFWGLVWGIAGMFLAVPITAILKIVLSRIETTKGFAELLSGKLPK